MVSMTRWGLSVAVVAVGVAGWLSLPLLAPPASELQAETGNVGRGAYLARASGCIACHTDVEGKGKPLAGGPPLKTPFGDFIAPNLTTDSEYGIGNWTVEQFARAVRQGIAPDGSPYYPAFPYEFYRGFSDQDIADLWAAFQTVPAVSEAAPAHNLSFPFNQRQGLYLWQNRFSYNADIDADDDRSELYNRGKYLVEVAAHCAACHSPRNLFGGLETAALYQGAESMLEGEDQVPAITPQALKQNGWTEADLAYALKSGVKADGDVFGGSMAEVVKDGTAFLNKKDRNAIANYLFNRDD